jgi:shikimate 5-dehydrogenase
MRRAPVQTSSFRRRARDWPRARAPPRLPWDRLATDAVAMDLVYRPRRTKFLAAAAAAGVETIDGLDMLAGQAVGALAFFRDAPLPADAAVRARDLAARLRATVD